MTRTDFGGGGRCDRCPIRPFERAVPGYAADVQTWLANPHAFFRAFGPEARTFQLHHRSPRLRTMTLVAPAAKLAEMRPVCVSVDGSEETVDSWEGVFACAAARLLAAHPQTFAALQAAGELGWLGCPADGEPVGQILEAGRLAPTFGGWDEVVYRVQWLFLMCGIRLNEVIVQVDPYTDETWALREDELRRKRENQNYGIIPNT